MAEMEFSKRIGQSCSPMIYSFIPYTSSISPASFPFAIPHSCGRFRSRNNPLARRLLSFRQLFFVSTPRHCFTAEIRLISCMCTCRNLISAYGRNCHANLNGPLSYPKRATQQRSAVSPQIDIARNRWLR